MLRQAVEALQRGLAVTIAPQTMALTTQEAADLLGVSRPTVIKLLDGSKIPYERVGSHRKILLRDLLEYRERRRAEQYAALEATAITLDDEDEVETTLARLREARRVVARRRQGSSDE
jgi:excisionase family DNA binding protein